MKFFGLLKLTHRETYPCLSLPSLYDYIRQGSVNIYLFMPLQKDRAAVFRRPLEAFVDVFHQQVHAVLVEGLHPFLDVAALEGAEHLQHQTLCTVLHFIAWRQISISTVDVQRTSSHISLVISSFKSVD